MIPAKDQNAPFCGFIKTSDHAKKSGLPGSVFATQNVKASRIKTEGDVPHCSGAAINFGDVLNLYGNSRGSQRRTSITFACRLSCCAILCGCILGGTLGLKLVGVEDAVFAEIANGKRLRIIFKSVGRRF